MSMEKTKDYEISMKEQVLETIKDKKLQLIGLIMFVIFWIIGIVINDTNLYELLMIIFSILFVVYYATFSIIYETKFNISFEILKRVEKIQEISERLGKISDEDIEKLSQILDNYSDEEIEKLLEKK